MNALLQLLNAISSIDYFYIIITLFLLAVYALNDQLPSFWCAAATSLNFVFLVVQTLLPNNANTEMLIGGVLVLVPFCFYIVDTLSRHYPSTTPKAVFFFEILVFITMVVVLCTMFGYFYVALCQHGRLLPQCLLWLLHKVGAVNLHVCASINNQLYHSISCAIACVILFSFSVAVYLATPAILSLVRRAQSTYTKFWE
jgi:small-conductance mechanosensitive channel